MNKIYFGDCRASLRTMAQEGVKVQMCVTSPPYYGLRDYGVDGQIGLEATPEQFIAELVEVFRCVRDVLADDGVLWVNIGDSYASKPNGTAGHTSDVPHVAVRTANARRSSGIPSGLKHKDLIGIPWMLAFALRADGWYLRQDIIWHKPNPMPESVTDRCTKSHEYVFLLSKSKQYFYDQVAVKEEAKGVHSNGVGWNKTSADDPRDSRGMDRGRTRRNSFKRDSSKREQAIPGHSMGTHRPDRDESEWDTSKRNRRSVWTIATRPYSGAHFAVFPPDLVEPCILAGTSEKGHCPDCGERWVRNIDRKFVPQQDVSIEKGIRGAGEQKPMDLSNTWEGFARGSTHTVTTGWVPACDCGTDPVPDIVLDPFMGSGTTAEVALLHGRQYVGCELNEDYGDLQQQRISDALATVQAAADAAYTPQLDLFEEFV